MASEAALGAAHAHAAMIPTPRAISAGCGMSMRFDAEDDAAAGMLARVCVDARGLSALYREMSKAVKSAKQNEEGCALPRCLYTVGFCSQQTKSAVRKNGAVKLAEMRVNRTHPRRSARPATALKAARSTRNLFISICRLLQRSNQANILRNFRGGRREKLCGREKRVRGGQESMPLKRS